MAGRTGRQHYSHHRVPGRRGCTRSVLASIGIDVEQNGRLPDGVEEAVTVPGEPEMLAALARAFPATHWGRLLFSAKESIYKAWYPLTGRGLGFEAARLTIDPAGTFAAKLLIDGARTDGGPPLTELRGCFLVAHGLVATAVTVPLTRLSQLEGVARAKGP